MKKFAFALLCLLATACATHSAANQPTQYSDADMMAPGYRNMITKHTLFFRKYDGFYETFRAHATLLSPEVRDAIVQQKAQYLNWEAQKVQTEHDRNTQEMATQTQFFLQLYTPEPDYNDLGKYNSIWRIYLVIDGHRFEGKVAKVHGKPIEFAAIYPQYDSFSRPYLLTFNIATSDAIRHDVKLVMASTLGTAEFAFQPAP
jgi:hypothetical protein